MIQTLSDLDKQFFFIFNSWHVEWMNPVMFFFSSQTIWLPFILLIIFFSVNQLERKTFYVFILFLLLAIIASDVTSSYILKNAVERLRPCRVPEIKSLMHQFGQKCGGRFGFVSSHAANSFCIIGFTLFVLKFKSKKIHLLWLVPLIVSFSRIYLGVHYPGDIIGGAMVGIIWAFVLAFMFKNQKLWGQSA